MSDNPPNPAANPDALPNARPTRGRRRRRWLKRIAVTTAVVLVLAGVALFILTRSFVLTPLLSRQLSAALGAQVHIDRAVWKWRGGVELTGLTVDLGADADAAPRPEGFDRLIEIERLGVGLDTAALRRGAFALRDVQIEAPVLRIVEDAQGGGVNLRHWLFVPGDDTDEPGQPIALPETIHIRGGMIRVERLDDGHVTELGAMRIDGTLSPTPPTTGEDGAASETSGGATQYLVLEQTDTPAPGQTPLRITGTIDRDLPRVDLEVADFDLTRPMGLIASPELRALWAEMDPRGALPTLRASFVGDENGALTLERAELVLADLSVTVPLAWLGLDDGLGEAAAASPTDTQAGLADAAPLADPGPNPDTVSAMDADHDIRMTEVGGRFVVSGRTLHVENFSGLIEGLRYHVDGAAELWAGGTLLMNVRTDTFELPETPPFILRLPPAAREVYEEYQPRGMFRASAIIERTADEPVRYAGRVALLDARAAFHKFPYPIENLTGELTFDNTGLAFDQLHASGPNGGAAILSGLVTDPGPDAKVDVTIQIKGIPADEHLLAALEPPARKAVEMFLHHASRQRLIERGLIRGEEQAAPDPLDAQDVPADEALAEAPAVPVAFSIDNRLNGTVRIERDLGEAATTQVTTTINAAGLRMVFKHFPYPITVTAGRLVIRDHHIAVDDLRLRGADGLTGVVRGQLTRDKDGEPFRPDLNVNDVRAPVGPYLLGAVPDEAAEWLDRLGVTGEVDANVRVTADREGDAVFRIDGRLRDGAAVPFGGRYALDNLTARFLITPSQTRIVQASGRRDHAVIDVAATIRHLTNDADSSTDEPLLRLTASATNLAVEPAVIDLMPAELAARQTLLDLFESFQPAGRTDAHLSLVVPDSSTAIVSAPAPNQAADTSEPAPQFELTLKPDRLAASHAGQRVEATGMTGRIQIAGRHTRLDALRGELEHGWAQVDGVLAMDDTSDTALLLSGSMPTDGPLMLAAVPTAASRAIAGLELRGLVGLDAARLLVRADPGTRAAVEFDAAVEFSGNTATLGVPITDLHGTLDTAVRTFTDDRPTELRLELAATRLRAADRLVAPLTGTLTNIEHPGWLAIERLKGKVYGGTFTAEGGVPLDGHGRYQIDASLQDAALGPFLEPLAQADPQPNAPDESATGDSSDTKAAEPDALNRSLETGAISANLVLEAELDDPASRRGRGTMRIRNARLFERRSGLGTLRVLNFAAPTGQPLDRAEARFLVEGNRVQFDHLEMAGPGLQITGHGSMLYPDTSLDIMLFTRNRHAPQLGPLSDFIDALKDELIAIHVTGTLAEPLPRVTALSGARNEAEKLISVPDETP